MYDYSHVFSLQSKVLMKNPCATLILLKSKENIILNFNKSFMLAKFKTYISGLKIGKFYISYSDAKIFILFFVLGNDFQANSFSFVSEISSRDVFLKLH